MILAPFCPPDVIPVPLSNPFLPQMLADDAEAGAEDEKEVEELKKQGINPLPKPPPGVGLLPTPPRPPGPPAPTSPNGGRPIPGGPPVPPPPMPPPGPQMPPPMHEPLSPQQQDMYKKIPSLFEIVVRPTGQLAEKLGVRCVPRFWVLISCILPFFLYFFSLLHLRKSFFCSSSTYKFDFFPFFLYLNLTFS